jgi:glycosyltransferase, family 1
MGYVNNTVEVMQAIDIMILPSLFEGLPLIAIESQALGIPILVSDTITQEVVLTDLCTSLPIDNPEQWAYEIMSKFGKNKYIDYRSRIKELGYDSSVAIKKIENIYKGKQ